MNKEKIVLADFTALDAYVMATGGLTGLRELIATGDSWALLLGVDLAIALSLIGAWLWRDAAYRRISALPYLILTALTGSIGPLLYLVKRRPAI